MNQKPPNQEVTNSDGDVELRIRLSERLNFLQAKVERFDFYIKNVKRMLDENRPNVIEIENLISGIEHKMRYGGSESTKYFNFGSKTANIADRRTGNVEADNKQDSKKVDNVMTKMESGDTSTLRHVSNESDAKHFIDTNLTTNATLDKSYNHVDKEKMVAVKKIDVCSRNPPHQMGDKGATSGWFINEGELAILAHDDGCCSLYDIANREVLVTYNSFTSFVS